MDNKLRASPPPPPRSPNMADYSRVNMRDADDPAAVGASSSTATAKRYRYLSRLFKFRQMDFEFALWQSWHLFTAPQKVYRNFQYRKQMKDQFARDDPAFLVVLSVWLCASSIGFAVVLDLHFTGFLKFMAWVVFVDCIGLGFVVATALWFLINKYLRRPGCQDKDVEWAYSFDVHLNAFFPLLVILHVVQLLFYHVLISHDWFLSRFIGNSLWLIAAGYYLYITFLGYSALPILHNTQVLLYPMTVLSMFFIVTLAGGWNVSQTLMDFYKYRVI